MPTLATGREPTAVSPGHRARTRAWRTPGGSAGQPTSAAQLALARGTRAPVRRAERETLGALVATFSEGADTRDLQDARRVLAALA
jgi:hypothetical protein